MRQTAELENHMTSVERVLEYTNAPQESSAVSSTGKFAILIVLKKVNILVEN